MDEFEQKEDAELAAIRKALQPFADCGHHLLHHKFVAPASTGIWVPRSSTEPQPPGILVKHLLAAAKALPEGSVIDTIREEIQGEVGREFGSVCEADDG